MVETGRKTLLNYNQIIDPPLEEAEKLLIPLLFVKASWGSGGAL